MIDTSDERSSDLAAQVFAGLVPQLPSSSRAETERSRMHKAMLGTVPLVLAGSVAISAAISGPAHKAEAEPLAERGDSPKPIRGSFATSGPATAASTTTPAAFASAAVPATYRVRPGDTVSGIAARHGLSTQSVLSLNGLSWHSLIFPGQVLKLTSKSAAKPKPSTPAVKPGTYTIVRGDTVSGIAARHGLSTQSVLDANGLKWSSIIYPGQKLVLPGVAPASSESPKPAEKPAEPEAPAEPEQPGDTTPPESDDPPSTPVVSTPTPKVSSLYVIQSGDTVIRIAAKFGVSVQSILDANGLNWSSIIYTGRTLTIPGVDVSKSSAGTTQLTAEMRANARIIVEVGQSLNVPEYGIVIALAAAMQESSLRNIAYGDRDSLGLFQQRPSTGWGTPAQLLDAAHAARLFYGGPSNPNKGKTRGLLDIPGWQSMTLTRAAQAVQISAYPNAYAKWEASARAWYAELR